MLYAISSLTADLAGHIFVDALPSMLAGDQPRRISRVATLDGGVVVNDAGFTDADRTIELKWKPTTSEFESSVARMIRAYGRLNVAAPDGFYLAAPEVYRPGADESTLTLLVIERLSA
jgi:hypothetical protein